MSTLEATRALQEFLSKAKILEGSNPTGGEFDPQAAARSRSVLSQFLGVQLGNYTPKPMPEKKAAVATPAVNVVQALAPTAAPVAKPMKPFVWFKHFQAVESALRIGDLHFAETLLSMLLEIADVLEDVAARARLYSQLARVKMEQKQMPQAEAMLMETLRGLEGTPYKRSIDAAYCLLALAQCYDQSGKSPNAEKARAMALSIAQECLDAKDPELTLFKSKVTA
jgi:hypothetical protein